MIKNTNLVNQTNSTYVKNIKVASNLYKIKVVVEHAGHSQFLILYRTVIRLQKLNLWIKLNAQSILDCPLKNLSGVLVIRQPQRNMTAQADIYNPHSSIFMKMVFQPKCATHTGTKVAQIHGNTKGVLPSAKNKGQISTTRLEQNSIKNNWKKQQTFNPKYPLEQL